MDTGMPKIFRRAKTSARHSASHDPTDCATVTRNYLMALVITECGIRYGIDSSNYGFWMARNVSGIVKYSTQQFRF